MTNKMLWIALTNFTDCLNKDS